MECFTEIYYMIVMIIMSSVLPYYFKIVNRPVKFRTEYTNITIGSFKIDKRIT
jgi:hypothetical protein